MEIFRILILAFIHVYLVDVVLTSPSPVRARGITDTSNMCPKKKLQAEKMQGKKVRGTMDETGEKCAGGLPCVKCIPEWKIQNLTVINSNSLRQVKSDRKVLRSLLNDALDQRMSEMPIDEDDLNDCCEDKSLRAIIVIANCDDYGEDSWKEVINLEDSQPFIFSEGEERKIGVSSLEKSPGGGKSVVVSKKESEIVPTDDDSVYFIKKKDGELIKVMVVPVEGDTGSVVMENDGKNVVVFKDIEDRFNNATEDAEEGGNKKHKRPDFSALAKKVADLVFTDEDDKVGLRMDLVKETDGSHVIEEESTIRKKGNLLTGKHETPKAKIEGKPEVHIENIKKGLETPKAQFKEISESPQGHTEETSESPQGHTEETSESPQEHTEETSESPKETPEPSKEEETVLLKKESNEEIVTEYLGVKDGKVDVSLGKDEDKHEIHIDADNFLDEIGLRMDFGPEEMYTVVAEREDEQTESIGTSESTNVTESESTAEIENEGYNDEEIEKIRDQWLAFLKALKDQAGKSSSVKICGIVSLMAICLFSLRMF